MTLRALILILAACLPAQAQVFDDHSSPPSLYSRAFLLVDLQSGAVLAEKNADQRIEPASLTKLMTAYLVFEALYQKRLTLQQEAVVSQKAWRAPGSRMFLEPGTEVSVENLLKGLIVQSGNDAAIVLAETVGGSEQRFVDMMNQQAQHLQLTGTKFVNATGLPEPQHYSTARDLVRLASLIIERFPEHFALYSLREFTYNDIAQYNRNKLLGRDPHVDGMKTGFTESAGFCLLATAQRDGRRLMSVVIDARSDNGRASESQKLLNFGFEQFETRKLYSKGEIVHELPVWKGSADHLQAGFSQDFYVTVPKGSWPQLQAKLESMQPLLAPIRAGQSIGMLRLTFDGSPYGEYPLVALESVGVANVVVRAWHSLMLLLD
ncbi:MAG: D-alanyl-D-alanine carboxypeptidase [Betaproteobacteria bacterium]|jgi:D-alanyl-D-alanine carboxypeptidase (penicillin-binding protein 5/6)|nr:MAG: D-alanyl-D-alanine carboxypeptidase [Betaproteobacteria bacterium]